MKVKISTKHSMHKGYKKYIQNLSGKNMKQKCHYRNLEINQWKILKMKL